MNHDHDLILIDTTMLHDQGNPFCACQYCRIRGDELRVFDGPPFPIATWSKDRELPKASDRIKTDLYRLEKLIIFIDNSPVGFEYRYEY